MREIQNPTYVPDLHYSLGFLIITTPFCYTPLGGSWVVISRVISRVTILIIHIRRLITSLITTHEPPSNGNLDVGPASSGVFCPSLQVAGNLQQPESIRELDCTRTSHDHQTGYMER